MGVASGHGYQEVGVASGWNLWVWLECIGVVVRRYIHILIIIITFPYSTCISSFLGSSILRLCSLTLGAHVRSEGYCSCPVCVCVCVTVCPLISAVSHIGITKQRYQQFHRNAGIVLNFSDFPKNASFKRYGVICLPRAAPAS